MKSPHTTRIRQEASKLSWHENKAAKNECSWCKYSVTLFGNGENNFNSVIYKRFNNFLRHKTKKIAIESKKLDEDPN